MSKITDESKKNWKFETKQLHVGQEAYDPTTDSRAVPIYQTTSYVFRNAQHAADRFALADAGNIYSRLGNPTTSIFEERIAALEGGSSALAVASGSAAITYTIQALAQAGNNIVAANNLYGGTLNLFTHTLPKYGITTSFVAATDLQAYEDAIDENTRGIFVESLGNPNSDISDLEGLAEIAHKHSVPLIVDNTFATPYLLRPLERGADVVVESATKFIGGHGTAIGGVIIEAGNFDWQAHADKYPELTKPNPSYHGLVFADAVGPAAFTTYIRAILLRDTGSTLAPLHSWLFLQGLETLSLRVDRHVENALKVVDYLQSVPHVEKVNHPSLSRDSEQARLYKEYFPKGAASIFTFEIKGGKEEAHTFIDRLQLFSLLANVADAKSLVIHPGTTTHSELTEEDLLKSGIKPTTIRLSIGLENIDDIIADLEQAFSS